jgi:hypothetical protein
MLHELLHENLLIKRHFFRLTPYFPGPNGPAGSVFFQYHVYLHEYKFQSSWNSGGLATSEYTAGLSLLPTNVLQRNVVAYAMENKPAASPYFLFVLSPLQQNLPPNEI